MLRTRLLAALVLLPIVLLVVAVGGLWYQGAVAAVLAIGVWELHRLTTARGYAPSLAVSWFLLAVILLSVTWPGLLGPGVALSVMLAMYMSLRNYHRGDAAPMISFSLTLGIALYVGWLGWHLLALRALPQGEWWTLTVLPCIFAADSGAYFVGTQFGRHKLVPWVSPKKSWEGYLGGVVFAVILGVVAVLLWRPRAPGMLPAHGAVIGLVVSLLSPLGDLTVSAFKRQAGVKDTGRLIPGHGGMMDRLDSVLIAAVLGYYYILWFT